MIITESKMSFGDYPDEYFFYIEKSAAYEDIKVGVKMAEFLLLQNRQDKTHILIVEAKETAPRLSNNQTKFDVDIDKIKELLGDSEFDISLNKIKKELAKSKRDSYFDDIKEKFTNSLALFVAIYLKRCSESYSELPNTFKEIELSCVNFQLILVIKNCEKSWLPPLEDKLKQTLQPIVKTWNLSENSVIVLNEEGAKKRGLVSNDTININHSATP